MRARDIAVRACVAGVGATLGVASPAFAGDLSKGDSPGDVRLHDLSQAGESPFPGTEVPEHRNGDLKSASIRYGEKRIRVALRFRELDRSEPVLMLSNRFQYPGGGQLNYEEAIVTTTKANRSGTARMSMTTGEDCAVRHRIRYRTNRATLSFPARCFSSPRWVAYNAWIVTMDRRKAPAYLFGDDIFPVWSSNDNAVERFTRRIRRP